MASKAIYSVVAVAGIAAAAGGAYWYQNKGNQPKEFGGTATASVTAPAAGASAPNPARSMPGVEVAKVETSRLQDDAQAVGSLRSKQNVMLRPEVSGRVTQLGFTDGGRLRKGDLVIQLDDTLQRAEVRQAQAQLSIAQANLKRNQELVAQNFVAQRVLDESSASVQVADAQVALACARWERMRVLAPFDGTVGIRNVNLGDYVKDGADLVNLEDLSSMFVDFRLPERFVGKLRREQAIEMQLDAMPGRLFKAKIEAIDPQLDANGRAVLVRATLPNTGGEPLVQRPAGGASAPGGAAAAAGAGAGGKPPVAAAKPAARPPQKPASAPMMAASAPAPRPIDPIAQACTAAANQGTGARPSGAAAGMAGRPGGATAGGVSGGGAPPGAGTSAAGGTRPQAMAAVTGQASPAGAGAGRPAGAPGTSGAPGTGGRPGAGGPPGAGGGGAPLRPGMFARVTAVFNVKDTALTIPEEAIVPQGGRQFVIRLIEQTEAQAKEIADKQAEAAKVAAAAAAASAPAGAASAPAAGAQPYFIGGFVDGKRLVSQRVEVKLGIRRPGRVEITEGLTETDTVVVAGQQRVQRDFTPVRVIELGRPPGGGGAPGGAPAGAPAASNSAGGAVTSSPASPASAAR